MKEHDCEEHRVSNCDGEVHTHFCTVCHKYLGETECPEKGMW